MATLDKEIEIIMLKGEAGGTIDRMEKTSTVGNVDTYTIFMADGTTHTFQVTNGTSIQSIEKTSTVGKVDTYTITLTNGATTTFEVTNGEVTLAQFETIQNEMEECIEEFDLEITKIKDGRTVVGKADETNKVKMQNDNASGKRYLLTTPNNPISGEMGTPKYLDWLYLMGDNNGFYVEDFIYAEEIYQKHNGQYKALHLYRHDIQISGTDPNYNYKSYEAHFTIYCSQDTALSITNIIDILSGTTYYNTICASGRASETLQSITKMYPITKVRKNISDFTIFYLKTEHNVESGIDTGNSPNIDDYITQIF